MPSGEEASKQRGKAMITLRIVTFGLLAGLVFVGLSVVKAQARHQGGAPRCMEAVVPKCNAPQFVFCAKKSKCGSCAKWTCRVGAQPH
jgi:hypothetical protein